MAFKRRQIPIAPLNNGVTTVVSDKTNAQFKTLKDMEQNTELGSLTSRRGINVSSIKENIPDCLTVNDQKKYVLASTIDTDYYPTINLVGDTLTDINPNTTTPWFKEKYGFSLAQDANYTYICQLSALLRGTEETDTGSVCFTDGTQLQVIDEYAPEVSDIFHAYGDNIGNWNINPNTTSVDAISIKGGYKYAYSFIYDDLVESEIIESSYIEQINFTDDPDKIMDTIILHFQRKSTQVDAPTPTGIKVYRKFVATTYDDGYGLDKYLDDNELAPYRLIDTITGNDLNERETGDNIDDNYVRYTDAHQVETLTILEQSGLFGKVYYYYDVSDSVYLEALTYTPSPGYLAFYNDRLMLAGDVTNKKLLFFSETVPTDFPASNSLVVPLVPGDDYITCMFVLGRSLYVASEYGLYRVTETSTTAPFYTVRKVEGMEGIGCIAPKTIILQFGRAYFLSSEGYVEFNGNTFKILTSSIDFMSQINMNHIDDDGDIVDDPANTANWYPPFLADATYDTDNASIYLALPLNSDDSITKVYKYFLKYDKWVEVGIETGFKAFVKSTKKQDPVQYITTDGDLLTINDSDRVDKQSGSDVNIASELETYDIDFGEETLFNSIKLWGTGTIDLYIYTRRSTTATFTRLNMTLKESGVETAFNRQGRELRIKIVVKDSENFKMTTSPVVSYSNNGTKRMKDME